MDMTTTVITLLCLALLGAAVVRGLGWWRRRRALARLDDDTLERLARGIGIRVRLFRTRALHGMDPRRTHTTAGDLALTHEGVLLTSAKGTLLTPTPGRQPFTAVRCPGPGRLVLEGEISNPKGPPGLFRFELALDDAADWAEALAPYAPDDAVVVAPQARAVPGHSAPSPR